MSAADRIRSRGQNFTRAAAQTEAQAEAPDASASHADAPARPADAPTVRTERIRRSVDLPPDRHYKLEDWCTEASRALGFKVAGMAVINALVAELLTDERLAERVRTRRDPHTGELELKPHRAPRRNRK